MRETFLANQIETRNELNECDYCRLNTFTITVNELSHLVHNALDGHFDLTSRDPSGFESSFISWGFADHWERHGEPVASVIADVAEIETDIVDDLVALLSHRFGFDAMEAGEENPYDVDAHYKEREPDDDSLNNIWHEFRLMVQHSSRFFNPTVVHLLDEIVGDLHNLQTHSEGKFIVKIGSQSERVQIWRARYAASHGELQKILQNPQQELGPPTPEKATAGRMNPRGVSVFYGAKEIETCISEIRVPVGAYVVLACFELVRPIKLLDLGALAMAPISGSYFDSEFIKRKAYASFLKKVVHEMSRPIMPQDEDMEYITTQVAAEYLKNHDKLKFDGLMFPSTQTDGNGTNIVLFNGSCRVEKPLDSREIINEVIVAPEYDLDIDVGDTIETGREKVYIQQRQSSNTEEETNKPTFSFFILDETTAETRNDVDTLRLIPEMTKIVRIKEVNPSWEDLQVTWHFIEEE